MTEETKLTSSEEFANSVGAMAPLGGTMELPLKQLPWGYQLENGFMAMGGFPMCPLTASAVIQWTINTWIAEHRTWKRKGKTGVFVPTMPHTITQFNYLTGESCWMVRQRIREYGISSVMTSISWELWPDGMGIGLRTSFLVPGLQWQMADAILWHGQGGYVVESAPGRLRGYKFSRPWGVEAKARNWADGLEDMLFGWAMKRCNVKMKVKGKEIEQKRKKIHP